MNIYTEKERAERLCWLICGRNRPAAMPGGPDIGDAETCEHGNWFIYDLDEFDEDLEWRRATRYDTKRLHDAAKETS